jgi:hypothetical protein
MDIGGGWKLGAWNMGILGSVVKMFRKFRENSEIPRTGLFALPLL